MKGRNALRSDAKSGWSQAANKSRSGTRIVAFAVIGGSLLVCGPALAYRTGSDLAELASTPKVRWENAAIEYEINEQSAPGVPPSQVQSAVSDAASSWASIACGGPDFRYRGVTSNHATPSDGRNTIEWVSDWGARGYHADAAGQTDVQYEMNADGEWRIVEADIYLNAENHAWSSRTSEDDSTRDVATVLTHELGHVLGLMHPCEPVAQSGAPRCDASVGRPTMHPIYGQDQLSLETDDEAGACFLYPSTNCTESSCGSNQVCTRGGCRDSCGGRACADDETCAQGACLSAPVCPAGNCPETCQVASDCAAGLMCVDGVCSAGSGQRGDLCAHDQECHSRSCVDGFCAITCDAVQSCRNGESCDIDHTARVCVGPLRRMGESCVEAHDCLGNQCLAGGEGGPVCSRLCSTDAPCPSDWACSSVKGRAVCTPPWFDSAGGCTFAVPTHRRPLSAWLTGLALAVVFVVRRPRGRRSLTIRR